MTADVSKIKNSVRANITFIFEVLSEIRCKKVQLYLIFRLIHYIFLLRNVPYF